MVLFISVLFTFLTHHYVYLTPIKTFKQQGHTLLKLGDSLIDYHESFKMYLTTKLPNPHYSPEFSARVTLINFTLSPR